MQTNFKQLDRLTEAYLAGVVLLEEYRRRRADLERRQQVLEQQNASWWHKWTAGRS